MIDEGSFAMAILFAKSMFVAWAVVPMAIGFLLGIKTILRR